MRLNDLFTRNVVTATPEESLAALARKMRDHHVGAVVVLEHEHPVGIVTDRDLALTLGAGSARPDSPARDVMTRHVLAIPADTEVFTATRYIRECGVRRLPIVDRDDRVVGLVSLDDLLLRLAGEMFNLSEGIRLSMTPGAQGPAYAEPEEVRESPSWIRRMLDRRGIRYQELRHAEAFTAQELAEREHFSGHRVAKVVVVLADGRPVELVLPATRRVSLALVRKLLDAEDVRLATEDEMAQFFGGCEVGAMPALRPGKEVPVLMDRSLKVEGDILFQAGTHRDAVRLDFQDWFELVRPQVASFAAPLEPTPAG